MCVSSSIERFFNKLVAVAAAVMMAVVFGAGAAQANPIFYSVGTGNGTATMTFQGGRVAGGIFTATTTQTFNSLGFIDLNPSCMQCGPNGLVGAYQVGIWLASTQTLLASAWVTPTSPLGGLGENFRYTQIPTVTIPAGQQFVVAALLPASPLDPWATNDIHTNSLGISGPGGGQYEISTTLTYPTQGLAPSTGYSIANASSAIPVPEPTAATLISLSLGGLAAFRRNRRAGT